MRDGALAEMTTKSAVKPSSAASKVSEFYGCNVFGLETMRLLLELAEQSGLRALQV